MDMNHMIGPGVVPFSNHGRLLLGRLVLLLSALLWGACDDSGQQSNSSGNDNANSSVNNNASGVEGECGSVRMTQYSSSDRRWCGFDRTSSILPDFVRAGMTIAIAEPYNTSSYGGDPGEACGECWEIATTFASQIVMVHDLCPIEGNPICAGSYFHFDVANEVADRIDGGQWMGEAAVRRVPCPVSGNIHIYITARNQYGYLQIAFFNHRFPIRTVEYRAADSTTWLPLERCLARWCLDGDMETFSDDGPGGVFRLTNALGEVIDSDQVLTYSVSEGSDFDTGVQFAPEDPPEGMCVFHVPGNAYDDGYGGIDGVRWESNTWGGTTLTESTSDCAGGSVSCLLLQSFGDSGIHLTYRHTFPVEEFTTLRLDVRSSEAGTIQIAPRSEEGRCEISTYADVTTGWTNVSINIPDSCPHSTWLHGLTISHPTSNLDLGLDNILFE
jgi:expansin (peptidoglycan-binding protein)